MGLLWTFMRYSRPYSFFGGVMESVAVILLCFRRTATLGALTTVAVMTNVAMMNLAYDVQVKLYACMIVASAGVLVLYDAPRILAVFLTDRAVLPARQPTLLEGRLPPAIRWTVKILLVGSVAASSVAAFEPESSRSPATALESGAWGVTSFTTSAPDTHPKWRRIIVDDGLVAFRLDNDTLLVCRRTPEVKASTLELACGPQTAELQWTLVGTELRLNGTFNGATTSASARRLDGRDYPLMRGGFHVIYDRR